jgi:membrane protease YdiL (CAAX protease family)
MTSTASLQAAPSDIPRPIAVSARRSRRGLILFFALLLPPTALVQAFLFRHPELDGLTAILALLPALASVAARLLLREGFTDVSFRITGRPVRRGAAQAVAFAALVAVLSFAVGSVTGLAPLHVSAAAAALAQPDTVILALVTLVLVIGEELGWRGYMLTRLISARVPRPVLTSGLIWGLWHVPLIYAGVYLPAGNHTLTAVLLMTTILPFAAVSAQLRLTTGSIWPPVVLHATWNVLVYEVLAAGSTTRGPWVGEAGAVTAVVTLAATAVVLNRARRSGTRR